GTGDPPGDGAFGADGPGVGAIEHGDGVEIEVACWRPVGALIGADVLAAGADGDERVVVEERDGRAESGGRLRSKIPGDAAVERNCCGAVRSIHVFVIATNDNERVSVASDRKNSGGGVATGDRRFSYGPCAPEIR